MMNVTRGREAAFFYSNYRIRVLRFLYGTLLSAYELNRLDFNNINLSNYPCPICGKHSLVEGDGGILWD